jgi:hypothetical protein
MKWSLLTLVTVDEDLRYWEKTLIFCLSIVMGVQNWDADFLAAEQLRDVDLARFNTRKIETA